SQSYCRQFAVRNRVLLISRKSQPDERHIGFLRVDGEIGSPQLALWVVNRRRSDDLEAGLPFSLKAWQRKLTLRFCAFAKIARSRQGCKCVGLPERIHTPSGNDRRKNLFEIQIRNRRRNNGRVEHYRRKLF